MIASSEIYLREESDTLKLIENNTNSWKWIIILDSDLVELTLNNPDSERMIFSPHT